MVWTGIDRCEHPSAAGALARALYVRGTGRPFHWLDFCEEPVVSSRLFLAYGRPSVGRPPDVAAAGIPALATQSRMLTFGFFRLYVARRPPHVATGLAAFADVLYIGVRGSRDGRGPRRRLMLTLECAVMLKSVR